VSRATVGPEREQVRVEGDAVLAAPLGAVENAGDTAAG
jgi:hypothetical protein